MKQTNKNAVPIVFEGIFGMTVPVHAGEKIKFLTKINVIAKEEKNEKHCKASC